MSWLMLWLFAKCWAIGRPGSCRRIDLRCSVNLSAMRRFVSPMYNRLHLVQTITYTRLVVVQLKSCDMVWEHHMFRWRDWEFYRARKHLPPVNWIHLREHDQEPTVSWHSPIHWGWSPLHQRLLQAHRLAQLLRIQVISPTSLQERHPVFSAPTPQTTLRFGWRFQEPHNYHGFILHRPRVSGISYQRGYPSNRRHHQRWSYET